MAFSKKFPFLRNVMRMLLDVRAWVEEPFPRDAVSAWLNAPVANDAEMCLLLASFVSLARDGFEDKRL